MTTTTTSNGFVEEDRKKRPAKLVDYFYELQRRSIASISDELPIDIEETKLTNKVNGCSIGYGQANTERILNWVEKTKDDHQNAPDEVKSIRLVDDEDFCVLKSQNQHDIIRKDTPLGSLNVNKTELFVRSKAMALKNVEKLLNSSFLSTNISDSTPVINFVDHKDKKTTENNVHDNKKIEVSHLTRISEKTSNNEIINEKLNEKDDIKPNITNNSEIYLDGCTMLDINNNIVTSNDKDPTTIESLSDFPETKKKSSVSSKISKATTKKRSKKIQNNTKDIKKLSKPKQNHNTAKKTRHSLNNINVSSPLISVSDNNLYRLVVNSKRDYLARTRTRVIKVPEPSPWEKHIEKVLEKRRLKQEHSKTFI